VSGLGGPVEEKDIKEAAKLYALSAAQGEGDSQFNLALWYKRGMCVKQDIRQCMYVCMYVCM